MDKDRGQMRGRQTAIWRKIADNRLYRTKITMERDRMQHGKNS